MFGIKEEQLSPLAEDILEKAYGVFVSRGFQNTDFKEIEAVTGVSEEEIERLFQTKSDILLRCMIRHLGDLYDINDLDLDVGRNGGPIEQLLAAITQYYQNLASTQKDLLYETFMVQHADAMVHLALSDQMRQLRELEYNRIVEFLRNTVEAYGIPELDICVAARCVDLVLEGEFSRYVTNADQTFEEMMRLVRENVEFILADKLKL